MASVFFVIFATLNNYNKMKHNLKDRIYYLKDGSEPISFVLQSRSGRRTPLLYFDEETGRNRALRYARNQKSPFEDEQDENAIVEPIIFEDGTLKVDKTNVVLQKFLECHPGHGVIFVEFDPDKDAEQDIEDLNYEVDALISAREMGIEKCEEILRDIIGNRVDTMTSKEVRRDILVYARTNPYDFLTLAGDPSVRMKNNITKFFEMKMIQMRNQDRDVYFNMPNNKKKMTSIPEGEDKSTFLFNYFSSEMGEPVYNRMLREL
jgi:hypothetical protein